MLLVKENAMANPKPEPVAAKEENDADAQHEQPDNQQTGQQNFGGPKRGGHNNRFGNRRPGPYVSLLNLIGLFMVCRKIRIKTRWPYAKLRMAN